MNRKYIFIPKSGEELGKVKVRTHKPAIKMTLQVQNSTITHTLYDSEKPDVYILQPASARNNGDSWTAEKFTCLYNIIRNRDKNNFSEEVEIVFAIHWGGIDSVELRMKMCDKVRIGLTEDIKTKLILTHYSGTFDNKGDGNILHRIKGGEGKIEDLVERVEKRIIEEVFLRSAKDLQEIRQSLLVAFYYLSSKKELKEKITEVRSKLQTLEADKSILKELNNEISEIEKSIGKGISASGSPCKKKIKNIDKYLENLIDNQLEKAGEKPFYGR